VFAVDISVGVAAVVPHMEPESLLAAAEIALDMAHRSGAGVEVLGLS